MDDLIQQQDQQRTGRAFISFLSSALGVNDQSYAGQDGQAYNLPRQYQTIGPGGLVGVEGTSSSNGQKTALMSSPLVLLAVGGVLAYLILNK